MTDIVCIVLAAGKGTRMRSKKPKVLHKLAGKEIIKHVLETLHEVGFKNIIVVVGYKGKLIEDLAGKDYLYAYQEKQLGTGHAVLQAKEKVLLFPAKDLLVLCGDVPLLSPSTLQNLVSTHRKNRAAASILTANLENPSNYGRIVRAEDGSVVRIVEAKDALPDELEINEVNTGTYCFNRELLFEALDGISPNNAQGEYYLTDVVDYFCQKGLPVEAVPLKDPKEMHGINDRIQLAEAEKLVQERINLKFMREGVTIVDPATTFIDAGVEIGQDTIIFPFTCIHGNSKIGCECEIGAGTIIKDSIMGNGIIVKNSFISESTINNNCTIGPYANLRPGTVLREGVKVGDFVEIKNSEIGRNSKVSHLAYLGDSIVGAKVNVGAGAITCNYDGKAKWGTEIGDGAFIGSNVSLVAPVKIGPGAVIGAGSTITKDVPGSALGVARSKQVNLLKWKDKTDNK